MGRTFRIKLRLRRFGRRHPWLTFAFRSLMVFTITFGGAYGFIAGSRSESVGYDPHTFAIGVAFLFAIACVALAALSVRIRLMRKKMRNIVLHHEAMADRNWELQEAEQRVRRLFEAQGDLIVLRDSEGRITYANDAYCELARGPRPQRRRQPGGDAERRPRRHRPHRNRTRAVRGPRPGGCREPRQVALSRDGQP
jgi:PAS domain-containing protein